MGAPWLQKLNHRLLLHYHIVQVRFKVRRTFGGQDAELQVSENFRAEPARTARIRLIPYYAWANRGMSHMTVWIPLAE
jgi:DUF1680 family protein